MSFFLVGRGPNDDIRVLSTALFATRQDAMGELSRISADPDFDDWDLDVLVMDTDSGVPVLLVRPQSAPGAATAAAEGDADAWIADIPEEEAASEQEPELSEASEELGDAGSLRAALERTTQQMTDEGISAPPSVGPAWAPVGIGEALAAAEASDTDAEELEPEGEAEAEGEVEESLEELPEQESAEDELEEATLEDELEPEPAEESELAEETLEEEAAEEPGESESESGGWPWAPSAESNDTPEAPIEVAEVYESLAEPEVEEAPELPEPVATGIYTGLVEPLETAQEPMGLEEPGVAEEESDFILDLDAIQPAAIGESAVEEIGAEAPSEEVAAESAPVGPAEHVTTPLTDYTCDDCVYVETCPNRDHRLPRDCGSFQWK
jgi:hypothetical protein